MKTVNAKSTSAEATFGSYMSSLGNTMATHPFAKKTGKQVQSGIKTIQTEAKKLGTRFVNAYKAFVQTPNSK